MKHLSKVMTWSVISGKGCLSESVKPGAFASKWGPFAFMPDGIQYTWTTSKIFDRQLRERFLLYHRNWAHWIHYSGLESSPTGQCKRVVMMYQVKLRLWLLLKMVHQILKVFYFPFTSLLPEINDFVAFSVDDWVLFTVCSNYSKKFKTFYWNITNFAQLV